MGIKKYRNEFLELRSILKRYIILVFLFFIIFFFFTIKTIKLGTYTIPILVPSSESISVKIFDLMKEKFLKNYEVIVLNPIDSVLISIEIAFLTSFILTLPYLVYSILRFIFPALTKRERKTVIYLMIPFSILFFSGVLFSLYFLIPSTFEIFYSYSRSMSITPYFNAREFITTIAILTISTGLVFTFPIVMFLLTMLGITTSEFWKEYWRIFVFITLVFTAWITPDGTGITMIIMTTPLVVLYFSTYFILKIVEKKKTHSKT